MSRHAVKRRSWAIVALIAMVATTLPVLLAAPATSAPFTGTFVSPSFVNDELEGCRGSVDSGDYVPGGAAFICDDSEYTNGNLGKGWNELDLVPHRLTTTLGTQAGATTTYNMIVAADNSQSSSATSFEGYDFISELVVNTTLSTSASCAITTYDQAEQTGVTGGVFDAIYRIVQITQPKGSTCVFDYVERLSITSSEYSGSSLQSYKFDAANFSQGKKTIPIPVKDVEPQELRKDMSATQAQKVPWNIVKEATPDERDFGNTCDPGAPVSLTTAITITWTRGTAVPDGMVHVITNVYAKNPAHRDIDVHVTDEIRSGTTVLDTAGPVTETIGAGTEELVLTHEVDIAAADAVDLNDIATATYTDTIFPDVEIPGENTATATATIEPSGTIINDTVDITDTESITGNGLTFSVAAPSVGALQGGYVAGTPTTGPVDWKLEGTKTSGSVTLDKTVYFAGPGTTDGTLSDTADVVSGGSSIATASASVKITGTVLVDLTISKTVTSNILQGTETAAFKFDVKDGATVVDTKTLTFGAGETTKSVTIDDLPAASYTVVETPPAGWSTASNAVVDLTPPPAAQCSGTATFTNSFLDTASAKVKKVTDPAGFESGWEFKLYQDNAPAGPDAGDTLLDTKTTSGAGFVNFATQLGEGSYYILETPKTGWTNQGGSAECAFTVNLPGDANKVFACTFTNKSRGTVKVVKTVSGAVPSGTHAFTFELRQGATTLAQGTTLETLVANAGNGGNLTFATQLIPGQTYQLCEVVMPGWNTTLNGGLFVPGSMLTPTLPNPDVNNMTVCTNFTAKFNDTTTFTVDNSPPPGGRALTIGFWKNWASCSKSGGRQTPELDKALYAATASGATIKIGTLSLPGGSTAANAGTSCTYAVNLLNKSTIDGKKKMASDPLFNMAAQLLAAKLNFAAGSGTCAAAVTAANQADALLVKYSFNGLTYSPKLTAADATAANNLATTLDRYNNNILC